MQSLLVTLGLGLALTGCLAPRGDGGPPVEADGGPGRPDQRPAPDGEPKLDLSPPAPECAPAGLINSSSEKLVDLFPQRGGIIVVRSASISLYKRDGTLRKSVPMARMVTSAAFDGVLLGVADSAVLSVYGPELDFLRQVDLKESCASSVIVSGGRFICGPANDWDRVFYGYDLNTATLLGPSQKYTYNGTPMQRVTGTDLFVTTSINLSPSDFHLYEVNAMGVAEFICESPYHGDFPVTNVFAYDQDAEHLVTHTGLLLKVLGAPGNCNTYLRKDGVLGTLKDREYFVGMDDQADGFVYGVVGGGDVWNKPCEKGCRAQKIEVATHRVVSEKSYNLPVQRRIVTRQDPYCPAVVFGFEGDGAAQTVHSLTY